MIAMKPSTRAGGGADGSVAGGSVASGSVANGGRSRSRRRPQAVAAGRRPPQAAVHVFSVYERDA